MRDLNILAENVSVDAGLIMIADRDWFKGYFKSFEFDPTSSQEFDVPVGTYQLSWKIPVTWKGKVKGSGVLDVTSGKVIVSDPCYLQDDQEGDWLRFCDDVLGHGSRTRAAPKGTLILDSMGGDGSYEVSCHLKRIKEMTQHHKERFDTVIGELIV